MRHPVLIIGGGPAGLTLAWELSRLGVRAQVLERGPEAGASWAQMPRHLKLLSPWFQNVLFDRRTRWRERFRLMPAADYARYLREAAAAHGLAVATNTTVDGVAMADRDGDGTPPPGFVLRTTRGIEAATLLVNATGYYGKAWLPAVPGLAETRVPYLHFRDYGHAEDLAERYRLRGRRALIVGKRVSAGQLVEELVAAGFEVTLSCRTPLEFERAPWLQTAVFPFYFAVEERIARRRPHALGSSYPPMTSALVPGWVRRGRVRIRPGLERLEADAACFADGTCEPYDLILFATGFRPALDHLDGLITLDANGLPALREMESATVPGLFFLGLDQQRNFRSRYLRGIRDDAHELAAVLAERLIR